MNRTSLAGVSGAALVLTLAAVLALSWPHLTARAQGTAAPAAAPASQVASIPQTINVGGEGRAAVKPDQARVNLGAMARAASVADAMAQADQAVAQMVAALKGAGVAEEDIQTTGVFVGQSGPPSPSGQPAAYQATQNVAVTVRNLGSLNQVVADAARAAGDRFQMQGVQFVVADTTKAQSQARQKALDAARARAEELARLSGLGLGPILAVSEGASPPVVFADAGGKGGLGGGGGAGILPGEQEYVVTVQVNYAVR